MTARHDRHDDLRAARRRQPARRRDRHLQRRRPSPRRSIRRPTSPAARPTPPPSAAARPIRAPRTPPATRSPPTSSWSFTVADTVAPDGPVDVAGRRRRRTSAASANVTATFSEAMTPPRSARRPSSCATPPTSSSPRPSPTTRRPSTATLDPTADLVERRDLHGARSSAARPIRASRTPPATRSPPHVAWSLHDRRRRRHDAADRRRRRPRRRRDQRRRHGQRHGDLQRGDERLDDRRHDVRAARRRQPARAGDRDLQRRRRSTATLDPTADLAPATTYTATVRGGATDPRVKDAAGNALAANVVWSFTTATGPLPVHHLGRVGHSGDAGRQRHGRRRGRREVPARRRTARSPASASTRAPANTGTHVGSLWTAAGALLGSVTFTNETATRLAAGDLPDADRDRRPTPSTSCRTSRRSATTAFNGAYFAPAVDNAPLHALANATSPNGVYRYTRHAARLPEPRPSTRRTTGSTSCSPTSLDTTPPTVTAQLAGGRRDRGRRRDAVTATFSEAIDRGDGLARTFELRTPANALVPATVSYDAATRTATLQPSVRAAPRRPSTPRRCAAAPPIRA